MSARMKMPPWFFQFISNFLFEYNARTAKRTDASINLKNIIERGASSSSAILVAMNDTPHTTTAVSGFQ